MKQGQNRLINEKSPYLLQHAHNPVDWYPWGDEAFKKAEVEDKPVFLSIGYSTCHWCHVMERESFEDEEIAGLINETFVPIKVDREERPDIDGIYMTVCQMLTGGGGWPLTIVMTPDKKPFFAGTYFPKEGRFGRAGLKEIIPQMKEMWTNKRDDVKKSSGEILSVLKSTSEGGELDGVPKSVLDTAFEQLFQRFDKTYAGFGGAPKFPTPHNLLFLLRYWHRTGDENALEMAEVTLEAMKNGGIYDHVGFGFHRYSTDRKWLVPHFEKMLYDQALLASVYTEAYQISKKNLFKRTAEEILTYVIRNMTSPEGGFYSAEDADSEGEEGRFYLWTEQEIMEALDEREADIFIKAFGIKPEGNWLDQVKGGYNGTNILFSAGNIVELSDNLGESQEVISRSVETSLKKLFELREKRERPHRDDKILTDWNGLMISAFAKAASVFNNTDFLTYARNAADFITDKLTDSSGRLLHRFREGTAGLTASADDYAFLIAAHLDLFEACFELEYLKTAVKLQKDFTKHYFDVQNGGYFFTPEYGERLLIRNKEYYDGAVPSGNSVAILNLMKLSKLTGNSEYEEQAWEVTKSYPHNFLTAPSAFTQALAGLDFAFGPSAEIVIAGSDTVEMLNEVNAHYMPKKVVIVHSGEDEELKGISPYAYEQKPVDGRTAAYVCRNFVCNMPALEPEELRKILEEK